MILWIYFVPPGVFCEINKYVTNYMLLYSTLLCKKVARAAGDDKRFMLSRWGGGDRIDSILWITKIYNDRILVSCPPPPPSIIFVTYRYSILVFLTVKCRHQRLIGGILALDYSKISLIELFLDKIDIE